MLEKWCGVNYFVNLGNHPEEPIGTASSMHECDNFCPEFSVCPFKKDTQVWQLPDSYDEQVTLFLRDKLSVIH